METREKLISAAIDLMSQEGYASFSTLGVAKAAGVSRGALQYHFDSRESLLVAVRTRLAEEMREKIAPDKLSSLSISERVDAMVKYYWDVFGSPRYVAALEIRIFGRFNPELSAQAAYELGLITEVRDKSWLEIFADSPLPREQLVASRRFMLDVMRGLAVRQIETRRIVSVEPELALLRRMLTSEIKRKKNQA